MNSCLLMPIAVLDTKICDNMHLNRARSSLVATTLYHQDLLTAAAIAATTAFTSPLIAHRYERRRQHACDQWQQAHVSLWALVMCMSFADATALFAALTTQPQWSRGQAVYHSTNIPQQGVVCSGQHVLGDTYE